MGKGPAAGVLSQWLNQYRHCQSPGIARSLGWGVQAVANKRVEPRQRRRFRVELQGSPLFTVDVSPGGFCAESMRVLPPGSQVTGRIRINEQELAFTGVVAWAKASEPRLQLRGRMGVRITSVPPEFYRLFADGGSLVTGGPAR